MLARPSSNAEGTLEIVRSDGPTSKYIEVLAMVVHAIVSITRLQLVRVGNKARIYRKGLVPVNKEEELRSID